MDFCPLRIHLFWTGLYFKTLYAGDFVREILHIALENTVLTFAEWPLKTMAILIIVKYLFWQIDLLEAI